MDVIILFFLLGLASGLLRSDVRLPSALYESLSIVLLLAIGLKGGVELAKQPFLDLLPQIIAVIAMGIVLPLMAYPVLIYAGKFKRPDAASIVAHYGSVSVGTYAVAITYLTSRSITFEPHMPLLLVVLEVPAILVGIVLARGINRQTDWKKVSREVLLGKGVVLLLGGMCIGWIAGPDGVISIEGLFFGLFYGVLALFLLEMGLLTASQFSSLRRYGLFILGFGVIMPLYSGLMGTLVGYLLGLSVGGTTMLAILAASASYIAVPAAMRISVPEANPTLSLAAALGVTFPFNVLFGIPIYYWMAIQAHNLLGG
jgi:uncharacterized protein